MPTAAELEQSLFALAPREGAAEWDNVGLLVGDPARSVSKILVALDITQAVAEEAVALGCDAIVAHHPVMNCRWLPVQTLRQDDPQGRLLRLLVTTDMAAVCMHTNLDTAVGGVNDALAEALELIDPGPLCADGLGRVGSLKEPMELGDFAAFVREKLGCSALRYADAGRKVYRVAVGGGACGDLEQAAIAAGCDTFVTSDIKYHQFLDAPGHGINLIDAGHFPTENPVCEKLIDYLKAQFPEVTVLKSAIHREVIRCCGESEGCHE